MKRKFGMFVLAASASLLLAPSLGSACEYDKEAMAAAPAQLAKAPEAAASRVPTAATAKAPILKNTAKQAVAKDKERASETKAVVVSTN